MKRSELKNVIREQTEKAVKQCPAPTQNLELNTLNRNRAISADFIKYGPLNLSDEGYWEEYAKKWVKQHQQKKPKNQIVVIVLHLIFLKEWNHVCLVLLMKMAD